MMRIGRIAVLIAVAAPLMSACATKNQLRRAVATERADRVAADSTLSAQFARDLGVVRSEVAALRSDLAALRTEFGAKIAVVEEGLKFALPVNFAFDDATVRESDHAALDRFARVAQRYYPGSRITVEGFADPAGTTAYNRALSARRAESVRVHLAQRGLDESLVKAVGYGETRLVVPGAERDDPGAEDNRRVVFVIETGPTGGDVAATTAPASEG